MKWPMMGWLSKSKMGDLILEIKSGFVDYLGESLATMQKLVGESETATDV